jgi:hypothetical protein
MNWLSVGSLLGTSLLLAGCSLPAMTKPGGSQEQYRSDSYECERDMRQTRFMGPIDASRFYVRCMRSRGYSED